MRLWHRDTTWKFIGCCGLCGASIEMIGVAAAALAFEGAVLEGDHLCDHFISELGQGQFSPLAAQFNLALMIGGGLLAVFLAGFGLSCRCRWRLGIALAGLVAGLSSTGAGVLSLNEHPYYHVAAAFLCYLSMFVMLTLIVAAALFGNLRFPKTPLAPALVAIVGLLASLAIPMLTDSTWQQLFDPNCEQATLAAPFEWIIFMSALTWIFLSSRLFLENDQTPTFFTNDRLSAELARRPETDEIVNSCEQGGKDRNANGMPMP